MNNKEAVKKLIGLLSGYKRTIILIVFLLLISTGINLCIPIISKDIMDKGFIDGNMELLLKLVIAIFLLKITDSLLMVVKEKKRINIAAKVQYQLEEDSFKHLMKLKINYFNNKNYAEILNNISMDIDNMKSIADENLFFIATQIFSMIGGIIGLCIINVKLTVIVLMFIPIKYVIMKCFAKQRKAVMVDYIEKCQDYAKWFGDSVGGIKEVRMFGIIEHKHKEFAKIQNKVIGHRKHLNLIDQYNRETDAIFIQLLETILYIIGANLVFHLQLSIGSIFAFITYSAYVTGPISAVLNIGYLISGIVPSTKRYYQFMDLEEEQENGNVQIPQFGALVFKNVTFSYKEGRQILKNVTFEIPRGCKTAIVGKNGSGKSTIINLILRLYEPDEGIICLGNHKVSQLSIKDFRDMVAVVSQQIYLFNDSIRNNICLYKEVSEDVLWEVIKDSGLESFLKETSLDDPVGENGVMLSGGQKQKIALARALVHNKPILIFDEATSNADAGSEMQIGNIIHTKLKQKTVIVVTHKVDILPEMDQIFLLEEGTICDKGTYTDLMEHNETFCRMIKTSSS